MAKKAHIAAPWSVVQPTKPMLMMLVGYFFITATHAAADKRAVRIAVPQQILCV